MEALIKLQAATRAAKERTGDKSIGTNVKQGLFTVVRVTYNEKGDSKVLPISAGLSLDGCVNFLNEIK